MLGLGHPQADVPVGHVEDERNEAGQHQRQKTHALAEFVHAPLERLVDRGGLRFLFAQLESKFVLFHHALVIPIRWCWEASS